MESFLIRQICGDEIERCAAVLREGFGTVAESFGLTRQNCPTNAAFISAERLEADWHKGNLLFGMYEQGNLIGFVQLEQKDDAVFELKNLTVLPAYRHLGSGEKLIKCAQEAAAERGGKKIIIGIIEENTVLKNWYLKHGFVHTGTRVFEHLPFTVGFMHLDIG